jgi:hypothetical protein
MQSQVECLLVKRSQSLKLSLLHQQFGKEAGHDIDQFNLQEQSEKLKEALWFAYLYDDRIDGASSSSNQKICPHPHSLYSTLFYVQIFQVLVCIEVDKTSQHALEVLRTQALNEQTSRFKKTRVTARLHINLQQEDEGNQE